jgi:hypothetical protein
MSLFQAQQQLTYLQQPGGNVIVINPHGVVPAGQAVQAINAYPGQAVPVMYSQQPQVYNSIIQFVVFELILFCLIINVIYYTILLY